jgi:hypothetical protein
MTSTVDEVQGIAKKVYDILAKDHPTQDEFRALVANVAAGVLAKRYLSSGLPFVFKDQPHKYLAFREAVGRIFEVPPQQIAVMGSARFGFSTSPAKQQGNGAKPLDENSDMDLVVISADLYAKALESFAQFSFAALKNIEELKRDTGRDAIEVPSKTLRSLRRRSKALHYGYVSPNDLEDGSLEKQRFYDMQREAATQLFGTAPPGPINRVGARVYRDWDTAERVYEFSFRRLAAAHGVAVVDGSPQEESNGGR